MQTRAADPYASTSLLNAYSSALQMCGRYSDALQATDKEAAIASEFGLTFVTTYAELNAHSRLDGTARVRWGTSRLEHRGETGPG